MKKTTFLPCLGLSSSWCKDFHYFLLGIWVFVGLRKECFGTSLFQIPTNTQIPTPKQSTFPWIRVYLHSQTGYLFIFPKVFYKNSPHCFSYNDFQRFGAVCVSAWVFAGTLPHGATSSISLYMSAQSGVAISLEGLLEHGQVRSKLTEQMFDFGICPTHPLQCWHLHLGHSACADVVLTSYVEADAYAPTLKGTRCVNTRVVRLFS